MSELSRKPVCPGKGSDNSHARPARKVFGSDRIGIVVFATEGSVIARPAEPRSAWLLERSKKLHERVGGRTNMTDGLRKAVEMLKLTPPGILRRCWLLSDGEPNEEESTLMDVVAEASDAWININCIGFGDSYNEALLRQIAGATHNGRFVSVRSLRELTEALICRVNGTSVKTRFHHRAETTVLAIDLSGSMKGPMEGKTKVQVVEEAIVRLLHWKAECFA